MMRFSSAIISAMIPVPYLLFLVYSAQFKCPSAISQVVSCKLTQRNSVRHRKMEAGNTGCGTSTFNVMITLGDLVQYIEAVCAS